MGAFIGWEKKEKKKLSVAKTSSQVPSWTACQQSTGWMAKTSPMWQPASELFHVRLEWRKRRVSMTDWIQTPKSSPNKAELALCLKQLVHWQASAHLYQLVKWIYMEWDINKPMLAQLCQNWRCLTLWQKLPSAMFQMSSVAVAGYRRRAELQCIAYMETATWRLHLLRPVMAADDEWPLASASEGAFTRFPYGQQNVHSLCDRGRGALSWSLSFGKWRERILLLRKD